MDVRLAQSISYLQPTINPMIKLSKIFFVSWGLLLVGTTQPVQASQAFKEVTKACKTSEETKDACDAVAIHFSALAHYTYLCRYEQDSGVTPEVFSEKPRLHAKTERGAKSAIIAFNSAIEKVKKSYPKCSVKPYFP